MTKYSPSPFVAEYAPFVGHDDHDIPSFRILDAEGGQVAETDSGKPEGQQEADAHLLAAAPELLETLQAQVDAAQAVIDTWEGGDLAAAVRALATSIPASRAAIARARFASA